MFEKKKTHQGEGLSGPEVDLIVRKHTSKKRKLQDIVMLEVSYKTVKISPRLRAQLSSFPVTRSSCTNSPMHCAYFSRKNHKQMKNVT